MKNWIIEENLPNPTLAGWLPESHQDSPVKPNQYDIGGMDGWIDG